MSKQLKKVADSRDALLIKEAIESLSDTSSTTHLGDTIGELVKELREARTQQERGLQELTGAIKESNGVDLQPLVDKIEGLQQKPLDVVGIIKQVMEMSQKRESPSYTFEVERNHSGVLTKIKAIPDEEG